MGLHPAGCVRGRFVIVVTTSVLAISGCVSPPSPDPSLRAPSAIAPDEHRGAEPATAGRPDAPRAPAELISELVALPNGQVTRRTTLLVAGIGATRTTTLIWDPGGGILTTFDGDFVESTRLLSAADLAAERDQIGHALLTQVEEAAVVDAGRGRWEGASTTQPATVTVVRSTDGRELTMVVEFGSVVAGGRDEWRLSGG